MKIGIVTEYYFPHLGGITEHVYNFSLELKRQGHIPKIITSYIDGIDEHNIPLSDDLIRIGKSFIIYSNSSMARVTLGFNLGKKLKEVFEREIFDIIHIHSPITPTLPLLSIKYSNARITVGTLHTHFEKSTALVMFKKYAQRLLNKLDGLISVSEIGAESLKKYLDLDAKIIPNGINLREFSKKPEEDLCEEARKFIGKKNIFFIGRFDPRNRLEVLIDAFPLIKKEISDARLLIAGYGLFENYYRGLIRDEYKDDVVFVGPLNKTRVDFYSIADVICYPTDKSSFGIVLLEAMACEKPLVLADIKAFRDIIKDGENGFLVEPNSPEALADGIIKILRDDGLRRMMGERSRERVKMYSWENITCEIVSFYKEILRAKNAV